jgi:hypothetical protein
MWAAPARSVAAADWNARPGTPSSEKQAVLLEPLLTYVEGEPPACIVH